MILDVIVSPLRQLSMSSKEGGQTFVVREAAVTGARLLLGTFRIN